MPSQTARRRLAAVLARLRRHYGRRHYRTEGSAVGELVATILSQNTSAANASAGYRQLWRRFRSWAAVANAPVSEIERCIRVSGLSNIKAPRIKAILQQVRVAHGRVSLEHLADVDDRAAYEYLLGFDGVGPKTAACVLMFAFGKPLFPVDTHIVRIAIRLGVLRPGTSAERAQELLTPLIAPADRCEMHLLLIEHGRQLCRARGPRCGECPLAGHAALVVRVSVNAATRPAYSGQDVIRRIALCCLGCSRRSAGKPARPTSGRICRR